MRHSRKNSMLKLLVAAMLFLFVPSQLMAGEPWWYRASQLAAGAAHGADLATTEYCLGAATCRETNAALIRFSNNPLKFGVFKAGIATAGLIATDKIANRKLGAIVNYAVAGFFFTIAARNTQH